MKYSRIAIAQTTGQVEAATIDEATGNKTCPLFYATLKLFQSFDVNSPSQGELIQVPAQTVPIFNASESPLEPDTEIVIGQMVDETWVYLPQGDTTVSPTQPWVRYRIQRGLSSSETGEWVAKALLVQGGTASNPLDPANPVMPGSEFIVADPNNLFPFPTLHDSLPEAAINAGVTGSIGIAYLRTPTNSGNIPPTLQRWEIESQTLPTKRMRVYIFNCLLAEDLGQGNPEDTPVDTFFKAERGFHHGAYAGTDFPNGTEDGGPDWPFKLQAYNPFRLTALKQSYVWIELSCDATWSVDNTTTPHTFGSIEPRWNIVDVEKPIARWGVFVKGEGSSGWDVRDPVKFREGFDPFTGTVESDPCRPDIDPGDETCAAEGTEAWGFYAPEDHRYNLISTESAMYGTPNIVSVVTSGSTSANNCGSLALEKSLVKVFCAPVADSPVDVSLGFKSVEVLYSAYVQTGLLCFTKRNVLTCDDGFGEDLCVDLCSALKLTPVEVLTGLETDYYGNVCFKSTTVQVCYVSPFVGKQCISICDLICLCPEAYVLPEFCKNIPEDCNCCECLLDDEAITGLVVEDRGNGGTCTQNGDSVSNGQCTWTIPTDNCGDVTVSFVTGDCDGWIATGTIGGVNFQAESSGNCEGPDGELYDATNIVTVNFGVTNRKLCDPDPCPSECECCEGTDRLEVEQASFLANSFNASWAKKNDEVRNIGDCYWEIDIEWSEQGYANADSTAEIRFNCEEIPGPYTWEVTARDLSPSGLVNGSFTIQDPDTSNVSRCSISHTCGSPVGTDPPSTCVLGDENLSFGTLEATMVPCAAAQTIDAVAVVPTPKRLTDNSVKPSKFGDLFLEAQPQWFGGCGSCKRDIVAVMNRWQEMPTEGQIMRVVATIRHKNRNVPENTIRWAILSQAREFYDQG